MRGSSHIEAESRSVLAIMVICGMRFLTFEAAELSTVTPVVICGVIFGGRAFRVICFIFSRTIVRAKQGTEQSSTGKMGYR
jgi:hypothetical protein